MRFRQLLVSGLCVTANRPAFLERAVAWWRAQAWPRKELVVVDGSRRELRLDFSAARDIRHVVLEPDLDMGSKHNRALAEAQGEILAYHDDDDWFSPRRLVRQLEPIALGSASVTGICRDLVVYTPGARFVRFKPPALRGRVAEWVGNGNPILDGRREGARFGFHDGTAVFARSVLRHGAVHPPIKVGQKLVFLNRLVDAGERFATVPNDGLFVYVRHQTNTWNYVARRVEDAAPTPSFVPADVLAFWKGAA
jgi:glycosyltransferase involved in cell wall biosynthesis